jgi:predicted nucleic acid-binding Zn ribbon protein
MRPVPPRFIPPLGPRRPTKRQRILASWRGLNVAPLEKAAEDRAKAAGAMLPKILADLRFDNRRAEAEIVRVWKDLLDPEIVAHAQPTGLRKGTLFVSVDSSVWLDEIVRYRRKEILERLRHSFGPILIQKISFRIG